MEGARLAQMKTLGAARAGQTTFPTPRQQAMAETGSPVGPRPPARGRSKIPKLPPMPSIPKDSQNAVRIVSGELSRAKAELDINNTLTTSTAAITLLDVSVEPSNISTLTIASGSVLSLQCSKCSAGEPIAVVTDSLVLRDHLELGVITEDE